MTQTTHSPITATASGGDLYVPDCPPKQVGTVTDASGHVGTKLVDGCNGKALSTFFDNPKYDYEAIPSTTTAKAQTGWTFYPDEPLADQAAHAQIFMADMLAVLMLAFILAGAVLIGRDLVALIQARFRGPPTRSPPHQ